jgi:hypothetical protein
MENEDQEIKSTLQALGYEESIASQVPVKSAELTIEYNKRMPDEDRLKAP